MENAASHYGVAVQPIELDDGAAAAETINGWMSDTTRGLIPTIVTEQVVLGQELVLVNTLYLKADWIEPFLPELTSDGRVADPPGRRPFVPVRRRGLRTRVQEKITMHISLAPPINSTRL